MTWQDIAAAKKLSQTEVVAAVQAQLSLKPLAPTEAANVSKLSLEGLSDTEVEIVGSAVDVLTNCLTEIFADKALERAKLLDEHLAKTGKVMGPLHGLPISLKDQVEVEGVEANMGYVAWVGHISEKNAALTDILLDQGAVLYVKTNIPQTLMAPHTDNAVFGLTTNPYNRNLTCGGSSGGEGALIALKGSPLGVGSDVGGSIRIPAAFNGLYGLRPSWHRVPYCGSRNSMLGQEAVPSVLGPLSSSVSGLKIFMQGVLAGKPWLTDPLVTRKPWSEDLYKLAEHGGEDAKLCFALMVDDGTVKPMPPYARALEMTKQALEKAGHKVIEWSPPNPEEGQQLLGDIWNADGVTDLNTTCALSGEPRMNFYVPETAPHLTTYEYWQVLDRRTTYLKKQQDAWAATKDLTETGRPFDAIIAPISASCPEQHGKMQHLWYTGQCNLNDWATGVFPVTAVDPALDKKVAAHTFRTPMDQEIYERYDPTVYADAPISLQCISGKGEEEAVIKMVEIIAAALAA
ncbi:Amidase domain-containing protein [Pseudohyphozyma bogoriensis]|nr:Amidase domain-containing protein [Pseudohyphozyma bogoriensis]